jgi:hypothetical protein
MERQFGQFGATVARLFGAVGTEVLTRIWRLLVGAEQPPDPVEAGRNSHLVPSM